MKKLALVWALITLTVACADKRIMHYGSKYCPPDAVTLQQAAQWQMQCVLAAKEPSTYAASDEEEHDLGGWVRACNESTDKLYLQRGCMYVCNWEGSLCRPEK